MALIKGPVMWPLTARGGFRERLVYVLHIFRKHRATVPYFSVRIIGNTSWNWHLFVNMSKHVVQMTLFLPMCQNTSLNLYYEPLKQLLRYPWQGVQNASNWIPEATFAHVHSRSPNSLKLTSWGNLWPRCHSKDFAFGVHRWDHFVYEYSLLVPPILYVLCMC